MSYGTASTTKGWGYIYEEQHSMLMCEAFFKAFTEYKGLPEKLDEALFESSKGLMKSHCTEKQFDKTRREGRIYFDKKEQKKLEKGFFRVMKKFEKFHKEFKKINVKEQANKQLLKLTEKYFLLLVESDAYFKVSGGRVFQDLEKKVKEDLSKIYSGKELQENFGLLLTPTSIDLLQQEELALLKLAHKKSIAPKEIEKHTEKYALHYYNTYNRKQVEQFIRQRIKEEKKVGRRNLQYLKELKQKKKGLEVMQKKIEKKVKNKNVLQVARFLRMHGSWRFELKNWWAGAEYRFLSLFERIAEIAGLTIEDFFASYGIEDVKKLLVKNKKLSAAEIEKRKKYYVFYKFYQEVRFYSGKLRVA